MATLIPDPANYEQLISDLIVRQDFEDVKGNPVRLRHSTGVVVDILPFNKWTTSKDKTVFGPAFAEFNLEGLNEVFRFG